MYLVECLLLKAA